MVCSDLCNPQTSKPSTDQHIFTDIAVDLWTLDIGLCRIAQVLLLTLYNVVLGKNEYHVVKLCKDLSHTFRSDKTSRRNDTYIHTSPKWALFYGQFLNVSLCHKKQ